MQLDCGPAHDRRLVNITIPTDRTAVGIFLSGGLDSAILYHLLTKYTGSTVVPIVIEKTPASRYFAQAVVNCLTPGRVAIIVRSKTVQGAILEVRSQFDYLYLGLIEERAEFLIGWTPSNVPDNYFRKSPLLHVNKSHIIDLVVQEKQEILFHLTHSCATQHIGRCMTCNRCRERAWGFEQLVLTDPGVL